MKSYHILLTFCISALFFSCQEQRSNITNWKFNDPKSNGFQKIPYVDQETGPGLVLVEGGAFTMGRSEQDVTYEWNNTPRRVSVSSFYIDQYEVTNFNWLEYLYWVKRTYNEYPMIYKNALPDTNCWRSPLSYNEPYVEYYLRHPAYANYPVVGISWNQVNDFCKWRTDRVNEYILIREGVLTSNLDQQGEPFTTDVYLSGQYDSGEGKIRHVVDYNPAPGGGTGRKDLGQRILNMQDGVLLPRYRLPTEAEWEFAYYGLIGSMTNPEDPGVIENKRTYPWTGHWVRLDDEKHQGQIRANFIRGRGDYMGVAGALNDAGDITVPVDSYWPNDYGLYNMAGNVSEWVMDVYRPLSSEDFDDFRPFRGNVFSTKVLGNDGVIDDKSMQVLYDVHGLKEYLHEFERVRFQRILCQDYAPQRGNPNLDPGLRGQMQSKHDHGNNHYGPGSIFISSGGLDSTGKFLSGMYEQDILLLEELNRIIDKAILKQNEQFIIEASEIIQTEIFDGLFEGISTNPNLKLIRQDELGNEYPIKIIPMLRKGMSDYIINTPGRLKWRPVTVEENINRRNYQNADYKNYRDGDFQSSIYYNDKDGLKKEINNGVRDGNLIMYQNKHEQFNLKGEAIKPNNRTSWPTTLISDKSRVYKGGAWNDRAFWIAGGNRRFLDEDQSTSTIGFRCAMDRLGSPKGLGNSKR